MPLVWDANAISWVPSSRYPKVCIYFICFYFHAKPFDILIWCITQFTLQVLSLVLFLWQLDLLTFFFLPRELKQPPHPAPQSRRINFTDFLCKGSRFCSNGKRWGPCFWFLQQEVERGLITHRDMIKGFLRGVYALMKYSPWAQWVIFRERAVKVGRLSLQEGANMAG